MPFLFYRVSGTPRSFASSPAVGIVDQHVGDRTDKLAVLNDGAARHVCGQVGTTVFNKKLIFALVLLGRFPLKSMLVLLNLRKHMNQNHRYNG